LSDTAIPRQGDHIFNAIDTALMRPFETVRSLRSPIVEGGHFIYDYVLHCYSLHRGMAELPILVAGRKLIASAGAEEDALRELLRLRPRYPALVRIDSAALRAVHNQNAERFGAAVARYELEILSTIQQALERSVAPPGAPPRVAGMSASPGIAFQQMLNAAYDPAAAIVVITNSASREATAARGTFQPVIAGIADTFEQPMMWKDPFASFHEERETATGKMIMTIREMLTRMDILKGQSLSFASWIRGEIAQKTVRPHTDAAFGSMLHLIHTRVQQMGGR
jgi:hypothetical protein